MFSTKRASLSAKHFLVGVHCAHCSIRACRILFQIITKYMVMLSECMTSILLKALKLWILSSVRLDTKKVII